MQGALALLPHSDSSSASTTTAATVIAGQQQQHLRGMAPAAAMRSSSSSVNTHAHFHRRGAAAEEAIKLGSGDLSWTADGKKIKVNGKPFHLKGVSWFGFEL